MSPKKHHAARHYDDNLGLRVPPMLWLSMLFLVRHPILIGITFLPTSGDTLEYLRALVEPIRLAADLPALVVLIAATRRRPEAGARTRAIWARGRWLLGASAILDGVLGMHSLLGAGPGQSMIAGQLVVAMLVVDLWICLWLASSRLLRDLFADFPPAA